MYVLLVEISHRRRLCRLPSFRDFDEANQFIEKASFSYAFGEAMYEKNAN